MTRPIAEVLRAAEAAKMSHTWVAGIIYDALWEQRMWAITNKDGSRNPEPPTPQVRSQELATAILAGYQAAQSGRGEWLPIESAPRDGTHLLLFGAQRQHDELALKGARVWSGYWDQVDEAWCSTASRFDGPFYDPTHWMPLPSPPHD